MAVKHHRFLLAALILAIEALAGSASADAILAVGETRLPSGVVVRINDAAPSAEENKRRLKEKFGVTVEERRKAIEALKEAAQAGRVELKLEIINALNYPLQSICDEYINYVYKFYARMPPVSLNEVVIAVSDRQSHGSEGKCVYKLEQGPKITREDGSPLPDIALEKIQLDESNTITVAFLSETNELGIQLPEKDILIVVPFAITDILDLAPYLTRAAQKLYSAPAYKGATINFVAVEKGAQKDTFSLPSLMVMAFRTVSGSVVFVGSINFQRVSVGHQNDQPTEIILMPAWNVNLAKATSTGMNSEGYKNYSSEGLIRDSTEIFNAAGRYAAEVWGVSQVVISYQVPLPGGKSGFRVPVVFELDNDVWRISNRHN